MNIYDEFIQVSTATEAVEYFQNEERLSAELQEINKNFDYYNGNQAPRVPPNLTTYSNNIYNFIKKIIDFKAMFLFGKGVEFENLSVEKEAEFQIFLDSWSDAKLNSHYVELAKSLFSYGKAAEIITLNDKNEVEHVPLIAGQKGQEFYAFFDNDGS